MKYIIIILCLVLSSCFQRPDYQFDSTHVISIHQKDGFCTYILTNSGSFNDSCGKFNIGDRVTTCKKN